MPNYKTLTFARDYKTFTFVRERINKMHGFVGIRCDYRKIVGEYDQEIPQSQTADKLISPRGRVTQQSRDTSRTNQARQPSLSPHQDDCKLEWT